MATQLPGWVKLVAIVSVVAVLLVVALFAGSFFLVRTSVRQFEAADRSFDDVADEYGAITAYRPEPDGSIRTERVEAFLTAREMVESRRGRLADALTLLSSRGDDRRAGVLDKTRGTFGLLRNLAPFHRERNETLMVNGVGLGEYYYLYTLAFYSWLGKPPADGPSFKIVGEDGYLLESIESLEESAVREYREEQARRTLNELLLPVLRSQLSGLAGERDDGETGSWKEALAGEVAALEADAGRIPWQDGLPEVLERSFLPYRDRLLDSYSAMCNAVEIGLARRSPRPIVEHARTRTPDA